MIIIPSITIRKINLKFKKPSHAQIILNNQDKMCFVGVRNKNKVYKSMPPSRKPAEAYFFF